MAFAVQRLQVAYQLTTSGPDDVITTDLDYMLGLGYVLIAVYHEQRHQQEQAAECLNSLLDLPQRGSHFCLSANNCSLQTNYLRHYLHTEAQIYSTAIQLILGI